MENTIMKVDQGSWRIEEENVRFFLLAGDQKAALIDTGLTSPNAREVAASLTDRPLILLNTHADRDHISGNAMFDTVEMGAAELAHYHHSVAAGQKEIALYEGDVIDLGNRHLKVIELPGHTPGSIAFLDLEKRVLISGDPVQKNGQIYLFGEQRSLTAYLASLKRLNARKDEFTEIWPSHGECPLAPSVLSELIAGTEQIIAGHISGRPVTIHGQAARAYDIGMDTLLLE